MVPKYVIDVSIIWLNDNIYSRNTWFPTTDVQTQNIGKLRYANRRAPTECQHTVATQATEYQRWRDVGCRSRRCRHWPNVAMLAGYINVWILSEWVDECPKIADGVNELVNIMQFILVTMHMITRYMCTYVCLHPTGYMEYTKQVILCSQNCP